MVSNYKSIINTKNLGQILLSDIVIKKFSQKNPENITIDTIIHILQSSKIEIITFPMGTDFVAECDEFWAHKTSSLMFYVNKRKKYRMILSALKTDISHLVFEN